MTRRSRPAQPVTPYRAAYAIWQAFQARQISPAAARKLIREHAWAARKGYIFTAVPFRPEYPLGYDAIHAWWREIVKADRAAQARQRRHLGRQAQNVPGEAPRPARTPNPVHAARWEANAVAQAVWATHQEDQPRAWLSLERSVTAVAAAVLGEDTYRSSVPPSGQPRTTGSPNQSGDHLDIRVPECPEINYDGAVLRLLRADLQLLERRWGLPRLRRAHYLRRKMGFEPGDSVHLDELVDGYTQAAPYPSLAMSWQHYLDSPRLGNVFVLLVPGGQRPSVQRRSGRSGDLGEAALLVAGLCRQVG